MNLTEAVGGGLFPLEFLQHEIVRFPEWKAARDDLEGGLQVKLEAVRADFPSESGPNEADTEAGLIWRVLELLGWTSALRQQSLTPGRRRDVPDGVLFPDAETKKRALEMGEGPARYRFAVSFVESKRWGKGLDRPDGSDRIAPATQMLRYVRAARVQTGGKVRFGILTNGTRWRLYDAEAVSVADHFLEVNVERALTPITGGLLSEEERTHLLTLFVVLFRCSAFAPGPARGVGFHERALGESRFFSEKLASDLADVIYPGVFESLVRHIGAAAPHEEGESVRDAALILLYRLLFIHYAEDRGLLPTSETRYLRMSLRVLVREHQAEQREEGHPFSNRMHYYWSVLRGLFQLIREGDRAFGVPPYNGSLFASDRASLLDRVELPDAVVANLMDRLGYRGPRKARRYINYRDLSVQQLGSIYERLLQLEVAGQGKEIELRYNAEVRRDSGAYYTPEPLVQLVIEEAVGPRADAALEAFRRAGDEVGPDPAERILALKICDPAMGSGHFLVVLVDYLTDRVLDAVAESGEAGRESPVADQVRAIRQSLESNAAAGCWKLAQKALDDRHIVRRLVLKRCVYGVDRNPLAVELAKLSLWLHSFTVGAPLGFLGHHLRCGDSLFGGRVADVLEGSGGNGLFLRDALRQAQAAARPMREIEALADTELAEAERSEQLFREVEKGTRPLRRFLSVLHGTKWSSQHAGTVAKLRRRWLGGRLGNPVALASAEVRVPSDRPLGAETQELLDEARRLAVRERFLPWEAAFPGVWPDLERPETGGFDAVIGNPPWDRMKVQEVEWFAFRRPEIARSQRAADRKRMVRQLRASGEPLGQEYDRAARRAKTAAKVVRKSGHYPLLGRGDLNLYSLFVERAIQLIRPDGVAGLLVPSGIASDKTAAEFFGQVSTTGRLRALYDFENGRSRYDGPPFFPDVHRSMKFCVFVAGARASRMAARCGFFLQDTEEVLDPDRCFAMTPADFRRVNPNTGTAPVFRTKRDQQITVGIYGRLPVLVDRSSSGNPASTWSVKYRRMFDMTNDSHRFRTRARLTEREGAWPIGGKRFENAEGRWVPLYEGKMIQAFDHRAASVEVDLANVHRPGQPRAATEAQHRDPAWVPEPQYWVPESDCGWTPETGWALGFKEITAATNSRTVIAALLPAVGFGNKVPILIPESECRDEWLLAANLNSTILDFVARQKIHGTTLNLFILEQLPVVQPEVYAAVSFGPRTAEDVIRDAVLELTYASRDMADFARHLGHVDAAGQVKPPFSWDHERRLALRAKLDAVFFLLYGVTDRDDVRYVYSTFPGVRKDERKRYGAYRSRDLCLAWMNALEAGHPDADVAI